MEESEAWPSMIPATSKGKHFHGFVGADIGMVLAEAHNVVQLPCVVLTKG